MTDLEMNGVPAAGRALAALLDETESDGALWAEAAFAARQEALERLEAAAAGVPGAWVDVGEGDAATPLGARVAALCQRLEAADARLFAALRGQVAAGHIDRDALWRRLNGYVGRGRQRPWLEDPIGYDALDAFVSGLLAGDEAPAETVAREAEMVYYQPTPARVVLRLIEWAAIGPEDVFFDLGSGLGQVCLLVRLLAGAAVRGVEIEPAYVAYARACAARLGLDGVAFSAIDARQADYGAGTVFFLYTPFTGHLLAEVLARLRAAAAGRVVRVGAYGPCTATLARQEWLRPLRGGRDDPHAPMVWASIP